MRKVYDSLARPNRGMAVPETCRITTVTPCREATGAAMGSCRAGARGTCRLPFLAVAVRVASFAVALLATPGAAEEPHVRPASPIPVTIGIHVTDVRDIDVRERAFFADFYVWMRHPAGLDDDLAKEIERLEFLQADVEALDATSALDPPEPTRGGKEVYLCWRVRGTFHFQPKLSRYPFDTQRLSFVIEHPTLTAEELVYVDDRASYERSNREPHLRGVSKEIEIPQFKLKNVERRVGERRYDTDFGDTEAAASTYSRLVFTLEYRRDSKPYFLKIIVPIVVILTMAYLVFWLPPKEISTATGLGITALLALIASNVSATQGLPDIGYLVVSDIFFMFTYALLSLTMLQLLVTYHWDNSGNERRAIRWTIFCRWSFPVLTLGAFGYLIIHSM